MLMTISSELPAWVTAQKITAQMNQSHEKICQPPWRVYSGRLCEAGLYSRIAAKKLLLRKQNNIKKLQWAKVLNYWIIQKGNKLFGLTNQSSTSLGRIGGSMCNEGLVKKLQSLVSHQP